LRTDKKPKVSKQKKKIKFRSSKRAAEERQYAKDRIEFLSRPENQWCAVYPWLPATQVHHKRGRLGKLLLDQRYWLGVSDEGHKRIENFPEWAKENNFSESRLS
jgi:hypothetical protein